MPEKARKTAVENDFLADWGKLQQQLWRGWYAAIPAPVRVQSQLALSKTLVDNGLRAQSEWVRLCLKSTNSGNAAFPDLARWTESMDRQVERWTDIRREAWESWFRVLENQPLLRDEQGEPPDGEALFRAWQEAGRKLIDAWTILPVTTEDSEKTAESSRSAQASPAA